MGTLTDRLHTLDDVWNEIILTLINEKTTDNGSAHEVWSDREETGWTFAENGIETDAVMEMKQSFDGERTTVQDWSLHGV